MSINEASQQETFDLLVEFPNREEVIQASAGENLQKLKAESEKAMNVAMGVIRVMADKVGKAIDRIEDEIRPNEMEVEFGLKLDVERGIGGTILPMIAKTSTGGQFNIKFKWTLEKPNRPTVLISENK